MSAKDIHQYLVNTLGDTARSYDKVKYWFRQFKCVPVAWEVGKSPGATSTAPMPENVAKIHDLVMENQKLTIRRLINITSECYGTKQRK